MTPPVSRELREVLTGALTKRSTSIETIANLGEGARLRVYYPERNPEPLFYVEQRPEGARGLSTENLERLRNVLVAALPAPSPVGGELDDETIRAAWASATRATGDDVDPPLITTLRSFVAGLTPSRVGDGDATRGPESCVPSVLAQVPLGDGDAREAQCAGHDAPLPCVECAQDADAFAAEANPPGGVQDAPAGEDDRRCFICDAEPGSPCAECGGAIDVPQPPPGAPLLGWLGDELWAIARAEDDGERFVRTLRAHWPRPAPGGEGREEFRVVDARGWTDQGYESAEKAFAAAASYDATHDEDGPHRVQQQTTFTSSWVDVPAPATPDQEDCPHG